MDSEIKNEDSFGIPFYEYGQPFLGSFKGMRYRIERNPMEVVAYKPKDKRGEAAFKVTIWPEPFSFENTPDEKKESKEFSFDEVGKRQLTEWLNEQYRKDPKRWKKD